MPSRLPGRSIARLPARPSPRRRLRGPGAAVALLLAFALVAGCGASGGVSADRPVPAPRLNASLTSSTAPTLAAAGDIACAPGSTRTASRCQQAATAALIRGMRPTRVLALGDEQYQAGALSAFRGAYAKSWGAFKASTLPVPGNHEYLTPGASGYYRYFGRPRWYATNVGSWRLYLLNSNCGDVSCARQNSWFARDLNAHPHRCSLMVLHAPRYSSGSEHGNDPAVAPLWRTAYRHRVDVALAGHDHDYERFARMDGDGHLRSNGIESYVVGTGGKSFYPMGTRKAGSRRFIANRFGVLHLTLNRGGWSTAFTATNGRILDQGAGRCS